MQQRSEGQHRRPQMCILESPWSRASDSSNANWPWLQIWAHQTIAISSLHDSHLHLWQSWQICCEHWLSPKFLPTGADEKYQQDSHGANPRTQIKSDCSDEHIKWKPLSNLSELTLTLEFVIWGIHRASKSNVCFKKNGGKYTFEPSCSRIAEMIISNGSPNQALQVGHAHLRPSRSFPRESRVFNPKLPYTDKIKNV